MTNFIANIQSLYLLWQQADLFPKFMTAVLFLSPVIFTVCGIAIVNYNIAKRAWMRKYNRDEVN